MRPPECGICDDCGEGMALVSFARTDSDRNWYARAEAEPGFVGHPPNVEWFCAKHAALAKSLADKTLRDALRAMRQAESG